MFKREPTYKAERNRKICEERKAGLKLQEIADRYGINKERVRQICLREERLEQRRRYIRRYGTAITIRELESERDYIARIAERRVEGIKAEDRDLIQKINNLIEVYSE